MIPSLDQYEEKKTKGILTIQKVDANNYALYTKTYDLNKAKVGQLVEVAPTVEGPVTLAEIDGKIAALDAEKAKWKALRADLVATV